MSCQRVAEHAARPAPASDTGRIPSLRLAAFEALLPAAAALLLYCATLSRNLSIAHDSIEYLNALEYSRLWIHPHHVLYGPIARGWADMLEALGMPLGFEARVASLNALCGALSVGIVYLLLRRRLAVDRAWSLVGVSLPALSFGFWYYSTCIEVYMPPLVCVLLALYVLLGDVSPRRMAVAGASVGAAVLLHQMHVLLVVPALMAALLAARRNLRRLVRPMLAFAGVLIPLVGVPYVLASRSMPIPSSAEGVLRWVTEYARVGGFWRPPGTGLPLAVVGFGRSFVGGHFVLALPGAEPLMNRLGISESLADERFLVEPLQPWVAAMLAVIVALMVLGMLAWGIHAVRNASGFFFSPGPNLILTGTLVAYSTFFVFWEPENVEFWIPQNVCAWLLFVGLSNAPALRFRSRQFMLALSMSVALAFVNFVGTVQWVTQRGRDHGFHYAEVVSGLLNGRPGLVLLKQEWIVSKYVRRYTGADVIGFDWAAANSRSINDFQVAVDRAVRETIGAGGIVILGDNAAETGAKTGSHQRALDDTWDAYVARSRPLRVERYTFHLLDTPFSPGSPRLP